jgi:hypothetical protein
MQSPFEGAIEELRFARGARNGDLIARPVQARKVVRRFRVRGSAVLCLHRLAPAAGVSPDAVGSAQLNAG